LDEQPHCQQQGKFRNFQFLPSQIKLIFINFTLFLDKWQAETGKFIKNIEKTWGILCLYPSQERLTKEIYREARKNRENIYHRHMHYK